MAEITIASASEALKRWYLPGLIYQLNNANPLLAVMERDSESVAGENAYMALRYGRHGGIGNRPDAGRLPEPNSRKTKQAVLGTKNLFARIQITDKVMRASRSNRGAFVDLLEADLSDALTDAKDNLSRQCYGDGSGKMAQCTAVGPTTNLVVSNTQFFAEGMFIAVMDVANAIKFGTDPLTGVATGGGALEIINVDHTALTITVSRSVTTLATDYIVINGSYNLELTGLGAIFTPDNTLYGINRATNKWFNPTLIGTVGSISEIKLQQGADDAERAAGGALSFYATSYGVRRSYQGLLTQLKRFTDVMELEGGFSVLTYNGKPFTADKYAPAGTLYGLDMSTFKKYQLSDWDWLSSDGAVLSRVPDKPVWEATLAKYAEIGCNSPKKSVKWSGITES